MFYRYSCSTVTYILQVFLFYRYSRSTDILFRQVFLLYRTACTTSILVLQDRMFHRYSCSTGPRVLQVFLFYRTACSTGIPVLQDHMLYTYSFSTGPHVLQVFLFDRPHVFTSILALQHRMFYRYSCSTDLIFNRYSCSTGPHVLQVFLFYRTACSTGILVLHTGCSAGILVLQNCMFCKYFFLQVRILYRYSCSAEATCSKRILLVIQVLKRARARFPMILFKSSYNDKQKDCPKDITEFSPCSLTAYWPFLGKVPIRELWKDLFPITYITPAFIYFFHHNLLLVFLLILGLRAVQMFVYYTLFILYMLFFLKLEQLLLEFFKNALHFPMDFLSMHNKFTKYSQFKTHDTFFHVLL